MPLLSGNLPTKALWNRSSCRAHRSRNKMKWSLFLVTLLFVSCARRPVLLPSTEFVLTPGMTISAMTPNGKISVTAGKETQRTFRGEGWTETRYLIPRTERWYGSLGLYDPAPSFFPSGRLLADEGRLFFETE